VASSRRLDAFDQWCLLRIVHIPYTAHITNEEVRHRTGQPPVTSVIAKRRIRLFGHLARADSSQDHSRILRAAINRPPADWRRRAGQPRRTWLHTIELDLRPHNLGLNTAWMRAQDRSKWRQRVETAILTDAHYSMMMNFVLNFHGVRLQNFLNILYFTFQHFGLKLGNFKPKC